MRTLDNLYILSTEQNMHLLFKLSYVFFYTKSIWGCVGSLNLLLAAIYFFQEFRGQRIIFSVSS